VKRANVGVTDLGVHREEGQFDIRIELSAEFEESYAGDADGYAWLEAWRARVRPRVARAIMTELRAEPGFSAVPTSRGKSPDDELVITVRLVREEPLEG
jgi:hypothetical protein